MILPFIRKSIKTSLHKEEIIVRISACTLNGDVTIFANPSHIMFNRNEEYFLGEIGEDSFMITKIFLSFICFLSPIAEGKITERDDMTIVEILFKGFGSGNFVLALFALIALFPFLLFGIESLTDFLAAFTFFIMYLLVIYLPILIFYLFQTRQIKTKLIKLLDGYYEKG